MKSQRSHQIRFKHSAESLRSGVQLFMTDKESALIDEPTDCSFDLPAMFVAAKTSRIFSRRLFAAAKMTCDLFDPTSPERVAKPIRRVPLSKDVLQPAQRRVVSSLGSPDGTRIATGTPRKDLSLQSPGAKTRAGTKTNFLTTR